MTTGFVLLPRDCDLTRKQRALLRLVPHSHGGSDAKWQVYGIGGPAHTVGGPHRTYTVAYASDTDAESVSRAASIRAGRFQVGPTDAGVYAAATVRPDWGDVFVWTSRPAVRRIYWTETSKGPAIATDAQVVARLAAMVDRRPVAPSEEYLRSILIWGYPMDGTTPFRGVKTLGIHELLHVGSQGVRVAQLDRGSHGSIEGADEQAKAALLVETLTDSIGRMPPGQTPLLRLSGGKDSRVLLAALWACGLRAQTETRGVATDHEVLVAQALAKRVSFDHTISGVPLSVPGDAHASVLNALKRTGGFIPSESHQSVYVGAMPQIEGQPLLLGQSHVQRGGFARTMRSDPLQTLYSQSSAHIGDQFREYGRAYIDTWLKENLVNNSLEALYEFHVQHRASAYLITHFIDYSREARLVYPMVDSRFVARCDQLTMLDKVSERIIFLAIQQMAPELVQIPLASGNWRFNPDVVGLEEYLGSVEGGSTPIISAHPPEPSYQALSVDAVDRIVAELVRASSYPEVRPMLDPGFAAKIDGAALEGVVGSFAETDRARLMDIKKYIWRLYDAVLWLDHFHSWGN